MGISGTVTVGVLSLQPAWLVGGGYGRTVQAWRLVDERPGPSKYLSVRTRTYVMPDASRSDWDILEGNRTVAVVALTDDHLVVLTRQFRPGRDGVLLELPGGIVDDEEDVIDAAARELREETVTSPIGCSP